MQRAQVGPIAGRVERERPTIVAAAERAQSVLLLDAAAGPVERRPRKRPGEAAERRLPWVAD